MYTMVKFIYLSMGSRKKSSSACGPTTKIGGGGRVKTGPLMAIKFLKLYKKSSDDRKPGGGGKALVVGPLTEELVYGFPLYVFFLPVLVRLQPFEDNCTWLTMLYPSKKMKNIFLFLKRYKQWTKSIQKKLSFQSCGSNSDQKHIWIRIRFNK